MGNKTSKAKKASKATTDWKLLQTSQPELWKLSKVTRINEYRFFIAHDGIYEYDASTNKFTFISDYPDSYDKTYDTIHSILYDPERKTIYLGTYSLREYYNNDNHTYKFFAFDIASKLYTVIMTELPAKHSRFVLNTDDEIHMITFDGRSHYTLNKSSQSFKLLYHMPVSYCGAVMIVYVPSLNEIILIESGTSSKCMVIWTYALDINQWRRIKEVPKPRDVHFEENPVLLTNDERYLILYLSRDRNCYLQDTDTLYYVPLYGGRKYDVIKCRIQPDYRPYGWRRYFISRSVHDGITIYGYVRNKCRIYGINMVSDDLMRLLMEYCLMEVLNYVWQPKQVSDAYNLAVNGVKKDSETCHSVIAIHRLVA